MAGILPHLGKHVQEPQHVRASSNQLNPSHSSRVVEWDFTYMILFKLQMMDLSGRLAQI